MKKPNLRDSSFIIFLTIILLYATGNLIWWKINTPVILTDISAYHFFDVFDNSFLYYNAPLLTWIMKSVFFIFDKKYFDLEIIIINYIFFLIGLISIYGIGKELKDKETGNISMILFALTPAVYLLSRQYGHQDWHIMIALTVNMYSLIKLNNFKSLKWCILYGISVGFGLLIKDEFLPYFFVPWLYVVTRSLMENIEKDKIKNILLTIIIGSLIACCHYFRFEIINKIWCEPITEPVNNIFAFDNLRITTIGLGEYLLSLPIFILFVISFIWFIIKFKSSNKWIILLWLIVPWLIILFMPHHKEPEYCLGFVPCIILLISLYISNISKPVLKKVLLIILVLLCFFQYLDFSYNILPFDFYINFKNKQIHYFDKNKYKYIKNINIESLIYYLKRNFQNCSVFLYRIGYEDIYFFLNINNFETYSYLDNIPKADIIIDIENTSVLDKEYIFNTAKKILSEHPEKSDFDNVRNFIYKKLDDLDINNNFVLIDSFYLDEKNKSSKNHISILGKKDLFNEKQNIIKYPYS